MQKRQTLTAILLLSLAASSHAANITVAVASNFTNPMKALVKEFEKTHPHRVRLSFNSSGKFFAQIRHGAPYDAFFSADQAKPEELETLKTAQQDSRFTYATGRLALWSTNPEAINPGGDIFKLSYFENPKIKKIAIANPKLAPYGLAAEQVIDRFGLKEIIGARLVRGENISQAYQFTLSGNAQLGFVALSQILNDGTVTQGSAWVIPETLHQPIRQDAVIINRDRLTEEERAVNEFMRFTQSSSAKEIIRRYGYQVK